MKNGIIKKAIKSMARRYMLLLNEEQIKRNRVLKRVLGANEVETTVYRKFGLRLAENFDAVTKKIAANRKAMIIKHGEWSNKYFNVACLTNTLSLILYSLSNGYIPVIEINKGEDNFFQWNWFFRQPYEIICPEGIELFSTIECDVDRIPYTGGWETYLDRNNVDYEIWHFLFKTFVSLNDNTAAYVAKEERTLRIDYEKTLGVLVRGTDYVSLKPCGHPVQPELDKIIAAVEDRISKKDVKVYLATEEERIWKAFQDRLGENRILVNSRTYYDSLYKDGMLIGEVHFDRDKDNYWKSIEYLSSLIILSRCHSLIAGNCGGTKFAMLLSDSYIHPFVFKNGYYL